MMEPQLTYKALATAFFLGPFCFLLGGIIAMALGRLPRWPRKNRRVRVVAVVSRMRTPAFDLPPTVYAPENKRVRTLQ